jgi:hypothetical protein
MTPTEPSYMEVNRSLDVKISGGVDLKCEDFFELQ